MPLSEQEQRLLEEMERNLYHNDADFVAAVSGARGKPTYSALVTGILVGVLGVAVMVFGVIIRQPVVGVIGFVVMFAGVLIAATPPRRDRGAANRSSGTDAPAERPRRGSFMQNLNERFEQKDRWDKRPDERDE